MNLKVLTYRGLEIFCLALSCSLNKQNPLNYSLKVFAALINYIKNFRRMHKYKCACVNIQPQLTDHNGALARFKTRCKMAERQTKWLDALIRCLHCDKSLWATAAQWFYFGYRRFPKREKRGGRLWKERAHVRKRQD